ncbi:MAG: FAD-dependent monooxygenase [Burkholderiaceae bacterium]
MQPEAEKVDVLIIGAGPVGLAVAVELGRRDIRCELVDAVEQIGHWWTRAMNMNKRTMEHMRRWGLAERLKEINFVPKGWPGNVTIIDGLGGRQLACARAEGLGGHRQLEDATEDALWIAQGQVQGVLLDAARAQGASIRFGQRAVAVRPDVDGADVDIDGVDGTRRRVRARYLIGCDGGRSLVRDAAGISIEGAGRLTRQVSMFFDAPDLLQDMRRRGIADAVMYFCADPTVAGTARLIAGSRWEFTYRPEQGFDESAIDGEAVIRKLVGPGIAFTFERSYPFWYAEAIATRFQQGRILIAGDAAHLIPPLGGHNLNLGFGDAVNLGWKLAHVLRGWADEAILESYTPERLPMVKRTAQEAYGNFERLRSTFERLAEVMELDAAGSPAQADRRSELSSAIARDLEPQWHSDGTVLDQRYTASPIIWKEGGEPPAYQTARYQPLARPGHRAPMWRSTDGAPLYDLLGPEYSLLNLGASAAAGARFAEALQRSGLPVAHLHLPDTGLRALYDADHVLIRPDQHVAWRGLGAADDALPLQRVLSGQDLASSGASR